MRLEDELRLAARVKRVKRRSLWSWLSESDGKVLCEALDVN